MSGSVGTITYAATIYNDTSDNVIKGIKMGSYLDAKIMESELAQKNRPKENKENIQTNTANLVKEIKEDMTK